MPFIKGNAAYKNRTVEAGGRKPSPIKEQKDAIARDRLNIPRYISELSNLALNATDEKLKFSALTYLIDRHEGKAKQVQDLNVKPIPFTQADYDTIAQVKLAEQRLLDEYKSGNNNGDDV